MPLSEQLRSVIGRQTSSTSLFEAARAEGMRTLREAAIGKVLEGVTTVSEMVRVTGG